VEFCSNFDETLAHSGPAAVFLLDREGRLRVDSEWTRDAWERASGEHPIQWTWTVLRDLDNGFVSLLLVTSATLLTSHPKAQVRAFANVESARAFRAQFGQPPVSLEAW